ncbi:MAG: exoribonuclease [Gammaproteobacteria bacterium]|nr:exoribonuclease [Gammaproteobacteria bacterium]
MIRKFSKKGPQEPQDTAGQYPFAIPSREDILGYLEDAGMPLQRERLEKAFDMHTPEEQEALRRRLRAMLRDGQLLLNRKEEYALVDKLSLLKGQVVAHRDGFGFVIAEKSMPDLFLSEREMRNIFHGDKVLVRIIGEDRRGRKMASVVEVLERNTLEIVGQYLVENGVGFVVPENRTIYQDILILPENKGTAEPGQIVTVEVITPINRRTAPLGRIKNVLGEAMAAGMEIEIATRAHGLSFAWPEGVEAAAKSLGKNVQLRDKEGRTDLRHLSFVTIDGEDAKDFDDAVFCKQKGEGWAIYVAIADVAHYVKPGKLLDEEAAKRGNSVYFPTKVIPMLPEALSNGLCSLKPKVDRLCIVCDMRLDGNGEILRYRFYEAVIHSHARLTYTEAASILVDKDPALRKTYKSALLSLENLYAAYQKLHKNRQKRGAIDFEIPEPFIVFNEHGKIDKIIAKYRNDAHKLIEECMLAANVCAADFLLKNKMPGLFRVHEGPNPEKLEALRKLLKERGLSLPGGEKPKSKDYAKLMKQIEGRPDSNVLQTLLLRSLSQAVYQGDNCGHFGLAYDAYTHFTSPIRRYPDLLVHRAIRHILQKKRASTFRYSKTEIQHLAAHCSATERRADEATRDVVDWLKCEYMSSRLGQEYNGKVTSVTAFGLFVALDEEFIEGLVHVTSLKNDYYRYDAIRHQLVGEATKSSYSLGDKVRIRVIRVDLNQRKIDFDLVQTDSGVDTKKKVAKQKKEVSKKEDKKAPKKRFWQKLKAKNE